MTKTNGYQRLTESQLRYLKRLAGLMLAGETGEVVVRLRQGGVIDFRESRSVSPVDLESADDELAARLGAG